MGLRLEPALTLREAAARLLSWLRASIASASDVSVKIDIAGANEEEFFAPLGCPRTYFKSRDCDLEWWGLGAADYISQTSINEPCALSQVVKKVHSLDDDQIYFGAMRFDKERIIDEEWKDFKFEIFILPLILLRHCGSGFSLSLNYRTDGIPYQIWRDHAESLLMTLNNCSLARSQEKLIFHDQEIPERAHYSLNVERALACFSSKAEQKKVVIGRRNTRFFSKDPDPAHLFFRLARRARHAFLFMFDVGLGSTFFGASPELLYRRIGQNFETESLAGTRPRSHDHEQDVRLRQDLFDSIKDKSEHFLVSKHIEDRLREFGATDLFTSKLEIMSLPYVQHLHRRYHGRIDQGLRDDKIIAALHPTPAVCGIEPDWAKQFIRDYEGFDRGLYAAPIGYVGKNSAEFAVGIRSALYQASQLFIYAACGIVPGSIPDQEWEELNNKQKNILAIFDDGVL